MNTLSEIAENIIGGAFNETGALVRRALDEGLAPEKILNDAFFAGMEIVGRRFREEEIYVPEVLLSARAMQTGIDILAPLWESSGRKTMGTIVFGTVKGDVHNLGKNLVSIMLKGVGFRVVDIGENVAADQFTARASEEGASIIAMSALLTTTMGYMKTVIEEIEKNGLRDRVKTLIGGACVTQRFADEIGADGYAANAGEAVVSAKKLLGLPG